MALIQYGSWGRYPKKYPAEAIKLLWRHRLPEIDKLKYPVLPYGLGKSYGDSCLNENGVILDARGLSRFIDFDEERGILRCEAGATLDEILNFFVPRGWFLDVTPGTKLVTVGGAIANDVHGKNHHKSGTFGRSVVKFELLRSNGEKLICSREENSELFSATIGGLGLTGLILWAEIKLIKIPSPFIEMESVKFDSLDEFFEINEDSDKNFDYTVAWVDAGARGSRLGRGLFNRGNFASGISTKDAPKPPLKAVLPFEFPLINKCSVKLFNSLYFNKQQNKIEKKTTSYDSFFYPLDAVADWNKAYGKDGFLQYQFGVPFKNGKKAIKSILRSIADSGLSSFLTVLKTFGEAESPGLMSFPRPGFTLAVDFRYYGEETLKKLSELDATVRENGGAIYPAKDARMSPSDFKIFYPRWKEFEKFIDPKFSSSFWRRVSQ